MPPWIFQRCGVASIHPTKISLGRPYAHSRIPCCSSLRFSEMVSGFCDIQPVWTVVSEYLKDGFIPFWCYFGRALSTCQSSKMFGCQKAQHIPIVRCRRWESFLSASITIGFRSSPRYSIRYRSDAKKGYGAQDFALFPRFTGTITTISYNFKYLGKPRHNADMRFFTFCSCKVLEGHLVYLKAFLEKSRPAMLSQWRCVSIQSCEKFLAKVFASVADHGCFRHSCSIVHSVFCQFEDGGRLSQAHGRRFLGFQTKINEAFPRFEVFCNTGSGHDALCFTSRLWSCLAYCFVIWAFQFVLD